MGVEGRRTTAGDFMTFECVPSFDRDDKDEF